MERKTGRNSGSNLGPTRTGSTRRVASTVPADTKPQVKRVIDRKTWQGKFRYFGFKMALPHILLVAFSILIAMVALMSTDTSFVAFPATLGQILLVTNGAQVASDTQILGLIPLAPVFFMMAIVAHRTRKIIEDRVTPRDLAVIWILGLAFPLIIVSVAIGMVWDAQAVYNVGIAPIWQIYGRVLLVYVAALSIGCGARLWRSLARRQGIPTFLVDGAVVALEYCKWATIMGALVYFFALLGHIPAIFDSLDAYSTTGGKLAVCIVSLLYLPNALLMATGIVHGAELVFGAAHISVFGSVLVPMPPLPVVAALPSNSHSFMFFLLLLGIIAPVVVAYRKRPRFLHILAATVWVAIISAWALFMNAGTVGVYGLVTISFLAILIMPVWWLLPSLIVYLIVSLGPKAPEVDEDAEAAAAKEAERQARIEATRQRLEARRARQREAIAEQQAAATKISPEDEEPSTIVKPTMGPAGKKSTPKKQAQAQEKNTGTTQGEKGSGRASAEDNDVEE